MRKLRCSFCKKNEDEVAKLVAGPRVYICDNCIAIAKRIMDDDSPRSAEKRVSIWRSIVDRLLHPFTSGHFRSSELSHAIR
jgi:ATP-dependent protease Clp ATPase subunit